MKRRTEITIETERLLVISQHSRTSLSAWCAVCNTESRMVTVDEAATLIHATSRMIYGWVEAGKLHWCETSEGLLLICHNSLFANDANFHEGEQTGTRLIN